MKTSLTLFLKFAACLVFLVDGSKVMAMGSRCIGGGDFARTSFQDAVDVLAHRGVAKNEFSGVIAVVENGKTIYRRAFGLAHREIEIPMRLENRFRLGSISKTMTALTVLKLQEEGTLNIDQPISQYLSVPSTWKDIRIKHLLSHTSGLKESTDFSLFKSEWGLTHTLDELFQLLSPDAPLFTAGSSYHYTDFGFMVLAKLVEKVTGKTYQEVIGKKVFDAAGMPDSGFAINSTFIPRLATAYYFKDGQFKRGTTLEIPSKGISINYDLSNTPAAGNVYSDMNDMIAFVRSLRDGKIVSKNTLNLMQTLFYSTGSNQGLGLGWFIGKEQDEPVAYHTGGVQAYSAIVMQLINKPVDVILLNNISAPSGGISMVHDIVRFYLAETEPP